jgi:hypothetical protein
MAMPTAIALCKLMLSSDGTKRLWFRIHEDQRHVELEHLGAPFRHAHAVAHHVEDRAAAVLRELPCEEPGADGDPEDHDPDALPVVLEEVVRAAQRLCLITSPELAAGLTLCTATESPSLLA